tara:strand:+ start:67 stop:255 length:189 start_codon:yes stop_codon:yes gene_type:complete
MDCSGQMSSVGMGAFIEGGSVALFSFLAAQFTAIRMKQKGSRPVLGHEAIEAEIKCQSMVGE